MLPGSALERGNGEVKRSLASSESPEFESSSEVVESYVLLRKSHPSSFGSEY